MLNILSLESVGSVAVLTVAINDTENHTTMFQEFDNAPGLIKIFGILCTKTGWDSDHKVIYYKGP